MGLRIIGNGNLENNVAKAQKDYDNSIEKLSTGVRFTKNEPMPVERARSDALTSKMRELNVYKQNANEGLSLTETAESELSSMTNSVIRLKELLAQATNPSLSDKERAFLFIEYQANYEDLVKTSSTAKHLDTTEFQGIGRGNGHTTDSVQIRVGPPAISDGKDFGVVTIDELDKVKTTPADLGIKSAEDLVNSEDGVSIDDVLDNFDVSDEKELGESFDSAQLQLSGYRAKFGAATSRLSSALSSINVAYENTAAANSRIKDVDYATEMTNLAKANILVQASTSLLAQRNNNTAQNILTLVRGLDKNS
jgi:flagellin